MKYLIASITAVIFGVSGFFINYSCQKKDAGNIPLIFSEISHIKRVYTERGETTPAVTIYYAAVNDVAMKVFEANNLSYRWFSSSDISFAKELEFKIDPAFREHHQITEYAKEIYGIRNDALQSLFRLNGMAEDLKPVMDACQGVWDVDRDDDYRTEVYAESVPDADGRGYHIETKTRQFYDHTDHTYTFYPEKGALSKALVTNLGSKYDGLTIERITPTIYSTGAENEDAISRSVETKNNRLIDSDKAKDIVLGNYANSTLSSNADTIETLNKAIKDNSISYTINIDNSASYTAITYSRSEHPDSKEYISWREMNERIQELSINVNEVVLPIKNSDIMVTQLHSSINEYINVVLGGKEGDASDLRLQVMQQASDLYISNYKNGIKINLFSTAELVLVTIGSGILGAAVALLIISGIKASKHERMHNRDYYNF